MIKLLLLGIHFYKFITLPGSPLRMLLGSSSCRHYPTCSVYFFGAVERYGFIKGLCLGLLQVVRCNGWSRSEVVCI